jgi:MFS family permease
MALTTLISANTYVQTTTEPHIRGRVMGLYLMLVFGGTPAGAVLLGWTSTHFGIRDAMLGFGIITGLGVVTTYLFLASKMKTPAIHWHNPPELLTSSP